MAAANTDLLRKKKSNFSTTLSSGISDSDTTIPLSSASGLPTDTAITLTLDRVDSDNVSTPSKRERVTGVIVSNNLTNSLRGEDNTSAQAHSSGAIVEDIWDAETWNDLIDAILVSHDQDGGHKADAIDSISEIASSLRAGADTKLLTGTPGTNGYVSIWNADGDLVDGYEVLDEDDLSSDSDTALPTQQSVKAYVDNSKKDAGIEFVIDGGGAVIAAGFKGFLEVPFACTIKEASLLADVSGSIVVDVWKDTYANHPPTDADSITASAVPTISSAVKSQDTTLTGWTKTLAKGDILGFNVDSCTSITNCTLSLKVERA